MVKSCLVSCLINYFNNKQLQVDYPENPAQLPGSFPLSVKKWKGNFYSVSITLFEIIFLPFYADREGRWDLIFLQPLVLSLLSSGYSILPIKSAGLDSFWGQLWAYELFLSVATCPLLKIFVQESSACSQAGPGYRVAGVLTVWDWLQLQQWPCPLCTPISPSLPWVPH